jgi:hypothetical protein
MNRDEARLAVLFEYTDSLETAAELLEYNKSPFDHSLLADPLRLPLPPEPHIEAWQQYAADAQKGSVFDTLQSRLVQLRFPIEAGISQGEAYRAATRRGTLPDGMPEAAGLLLQQPDRLQLLLHQGLWGVIPVLITGCRHDFVCLVQAFTKRNEPAPIPDSMGSAIISGYNNWDRIGQLRRLWETEHPANTSAAAWAEEFRQYILPHKELYQDRFMVISNGPYSGVPADEMGLSSDDWQRLSVTIRLEHEATHYFTHRLFSAMRNNILDELLADYRGIVTANGRYRADWFLRFLGLHDFPTYHSGRRLENYRGDPPLSDEAFRVLQALVKAAAENLERFDHDQANELTTTDAQARLLLALTRLTLEELASREAVAFIQQALQSLPSQESTS